MESKSSEQIKLEVQEWQITNALVGILGVLAPAACLAFLLGRSGALIDFLLNIDHSKPKASPLNFHRWLTTLLFWPLRCHHRGPPISRFQCRRQADTRNPLHVWREGSLLCMLVNSAVPGACKDPREHRLKTPRHGMKLVMEYFDIQPIFTEDELNQKHLTVHQETKFSKYLHGVHKSISKHRDCVNNMRFSTDYVARGMGLVIGEQNRKSIFYIYPIPKHNQQPCDLEVTIKGPCGNNGYIVIPSILHYQQRCQPPTEYRRAMYMSSKLNSISPTIQGTSFFRKLSLNTTSRTMEIDIRVKISSTRAKVTYIPQKTGVYEVTLVTKDSHVVGSPYSVPIELCSSSSYLSNDSDNDSDEANEGKYIKRKKKIISRIVDFIDEKMLLQNDGTLIRIDAGDVKHSQGNQQNKNDVNNKIIKNNAESIAQNSEKITENKILIVPESNNNVIEGINNEKIKLETNHLKDKRNNNSNNEYGCNKLDDHISTDNETSTINDEIQYNFRETLNQFNKNVNEIETNKYVLKKNATTMKQNNEKYFEIQSKETNVSEDIKEPLHNEPIKESNSANDEENDNILFNVSLNYNPESTYVSEVHIDIADLTETQYNSNHSAPDILETSNRNVENSASFTKIVKEEQNLKNYSSKSSSVDPTLLSKVRDPRLDYPVKVSEFRKTFSKKDPSYDVTYCCSDDKSSLVNNLVKIFEVPNPECSSFDKQTTETNNQIFSSDEDTFKNISSLNDPDLVKCHVKNCTPPILSTKSYDSIQKENKTIQSKLKSIGAISDDYDKQQCYLKDCLQHSLQQCFTKNISDQNTLQSGIVNRQKQFWDKKTSYHKGYFNNKNVKQKIVLKDSFIVETKDDNNTSSSNLLYFKPFEGIVENNIKIFENKLFSSTSQINEVKCKKLELQRSKSESFLQEPTKIYQVEKTFSEEKIILPSIEERKIKFLQACQLSSSTADKKCFVKHEESKQTVQHFDPTKNQNLVLNEVSTSKPQNPKIEKKQSFKRKARFKRAKLFFHHLEGSDPKIEPFKFEDNSKNIKISRSESDSCVSYKKPTKSIKISQRFQVDDLFQDILGDDKRFFGIPNKMAVVASLASLNSDSSHAEHDFENEGEPDLNCFAGKPKKIERKKKSISGFHEDYPHLPTTNTWRYKPRSNMTKDELIPGRVLLTKDQDILKAT